MAEIVTEQGKWDKLGIKLDCDPRLDYQEPAVAAEGEGDSSDAPDEVQQIKGIFDAYGVGVRAGAITPVLDDEEYFREKAGFAPLSAAAREAWAKDKGVRRPITLAAVEAGTPPSAQAPESE